MPPRPILRKSAAFRQGEITSLWLTSRNERGGDKCTPAAKGRYCRARRTGCRAKVAQLPFSAVSRAVGVFKQAAQVAMERTAAHDRRGNGGQPAHSDGFAILPSAYRIQNPTGIADSVLLPPEFTPSKFALVG
jgi:hypothetical protein